MSHIAMLGIDENGDVTYYAPRGTSRSRTRTSAPVPGEPTPRARTVTRGYSTGLVPLGRITSDTDVPDGLEGPATLSVVYS